MTRLRPVPRGLLSFSGLLAVCALCSAPADLHAQESESVACGQLFAATHAVLAEVAGACTSPPGDLNGDVIQLTERGVLAWRAGDGVVAFMDREGRSIHLQGWAGVEEHVSDEPGETARIVQGISMAMSVQIVMLGLDGVDLPQPTSVQTTSVWIDGGVQPLLDACGSDLLSTWMSRGLDAGVDAGSAYPASC